MSQLLFRKQLQKKNFTFFDEVEDEIWKKYSKICLLMNTHKTLGISPKDFLNAINDKDFNLITVALLLNSVDQIPYYELNREEGISIDGYCDLLNRNIEIGEIWRSITDPILQKINQQNESNTSTN